MKPLSIENSLIKAKSLSKKGQINESINILQIVLKNFPNNIRVQQALKHLTTSNNNFVDKKIPENELKRLYVLYNSTETNKFLYEAEKILKQYPYAFMVWNLLGIVKAKNGNLLEATNCFKKVVELNPQFPDGFNNLGNILAEQEKFDEAIISFKIALSLNPLMESVYNNIGNIFFKKSDLQNAKIHYEKSISVNGNFIDALNNLGNTYQLLGNSIESIETYKKALLLDPSNAVYWNNIAYPILTINTNKSIVDKILQDLQKDDRFKTQEIYKHILKYKIFRSRHIPENIYNFLIESLSKVNNTIKPKREFYVEQPISKLNAPQKMISLVHFGRSGTGLLHSLIDGHPEITTLPSIYFSEYFDQSTWEKITNDGWDLITENFMNIYDVLFDARSIIAIQSIEKKMISNIGVKEGMTCLGENKDKHLSVDKNKFRQELNNLLSHCEEIDQLSFFKLVHIAYEKTLNYSMNKNTIFYHIHNPDVYAQFNLAQYDKNTSWIMMVREPIQSCESWIRDSLNNKDYEECIFRITKMLLEVDNIIYKKNKSIGVRLEDLKKFPNKTLPALCKWMGVKENKNLYKMTMQGEKWWGDPTSPDYASDGMNPFGNKSIDRKTGSIFSQEDKFILNTLFYPFCVQFGYINENSEKFKLDLQKVNPMIDKIFDFEKIIIEHTNQNVANFMQSGTYNYFRSVLKDRWDILNEYHTYPNLIKSLKID